MLPVVTYLIYPKNLLYPIAQAKNKEAKHTYLSFRFRLQDISLVHFSFLFFDEPRNGCGKKTKQIQYKHIYFPLCKHDCVFQVCNIYAICKILMP